jgi:hypothetical protein
MTSFTQTRRLTREQYEASVASWTAGSPWSGEWKKWRHMAAMEAGIVMAPTGDPYDSWADEQPSERAMLIRAIRETPDALAAAIRSPRVHSWAAVVAVLTRGRDELYAEVDMGVRHRPVDEANPAQARRTLERIGVVLQGPR